MPESCCLQKAPQPEIYLCHSDRHGVIQCQTTRINAAAETEEKKSKLELRERLKTEYLNFEDWTASASFVFVSLSLHITRAPHSSANPPKSPRHRLDPPRPPRSRLDPPRPPRSRLDPPRPPRRRLDPPRPPRSAQAA
ncbi:unnamed protein product [Prunus armeniaca]